MAENTHSTTDLNQLKSWFRTGLKPTQAQFWAWLDSFYHKDEEIPQEKIKGLSQSLENKADVSAMETKANADASGLSEEYITAWKQALGVGELPSNIATVDEAEKQGNVYTKEKVNELLESSGKNLGNSDLKISPGEVRTLDTTGAKLLIKGLENKTSDRSFNLRVKMNEKGELAFSEELDIVNNISVTMPSTVNINLKTTLPEWKTSTITANKLSDEQIRLLNRIVALENDTSFTKYRADEILINKLPKSQYPSGQENYELPSLIKDDGLLVNDSLHNIPDSFFNTTWINDTDTAGYNLFYNIIFNKELPSDKDWIVYFRTYDSTLMFNLHNVDGKGNFNGTGCNYGFRYSLNNVFNANLNMNERCFVFGSWFRHRLSIFNVDKNNNHIEITGTFVKWYFIKTGSLLSVIKMDQINGNVQIVTTQYNEHFKFFNIESPITHYTKTINKFSMKDISYWIET